MPRIRNEDDLELRRQLIFRQVVLDNTPLPLKKLREWLEADYYYDEKTADTDIGAFKKVGCNLVRQKCQSDSEDQELVFVEGAHVDSDRTREEINKEPKHLVARLAASLICGIPKPDDDDKAFAETLRTLELVEKLKTLSKIDETLCNRVRLLAEHFEEKQKPHCGTNRVIPLEVIMRLLSKDAFSESQKKNLKKSLKVFWETTSRMVAIDSGTTNLELCNVIKEMQIPVVKTRLCSLTVCTNSRRILEVLGPSSVWVKTIVIGGKQMFRTSTIAGAMAEQFLRSAAILHFGMCSIGATRIDVDRGTICSDSQEESSIKNLLMERSALRVICADDSKIQKGPGRQGYRFASIDPNHIDLIVTNAPLIKNGKENPNEYYGEFLENVQAIEDRGVPVLIATSPETFGHVEKQTSPKT